MPARSVGSSLGDAFRTFDFMPKPIAAGVSPIDDAQAKPFAGCIADRDFGYSPNGVADKSFGKLCARIE
jgi:hypothetical protein